MLQKNSKILLKPMLVLKFLNSNVNLKNINGTTGTRTGMKLEHEQMVRRMVKVLMQTGKETKCG